MVKANLKIPQVLKALGDENRFQIVKLLLQGNLCVGALSRILNISAPAVSRHLSILRKAGLVRGEKIGYWTHYRVEKDLLNDVSFYIKGLTEQEPLSSGEDRYTCLKESGTNHKAEKEVSPMCKNCCEQPDKLKTVPSKCTPEQVKDCHGDKGEHPCRQDQNEDGK